MLVLYKKSFFGALVHEENRGLSDLNAKEMTALIPLVALVVLLGVYPKPLLSTIDMSVQKMLVLMEQKAIAPATKELIINANTIGGTR
jgi:NADH-quinone oxidoreductase subunit M